MRAVFTILVAVPLLLATSGDARANGKRLGYEKQVAEHLERTLAAKPQTFQFTNLRNLSQGENVAAAGGASLVRSKNGLTARMMVADLMPGHAYTFWWIIFNDPDECAQTPCGAADLVAANGAVHYGSGAVSGENGAANVSFSTTSGGPPEGAIFNGALAQHGLMTDRGFLAEVHLVVVEHGVPSLADFNSSNPDVPGTWGWELTHPLPPGPAWIRAAIFLPQ